MEAVCIDRLVRPDHPVPPARLARFGVRAGGVLIAGQRVEQQDRVVLARGQRAIRLLGDFDIVERLPAIERERRGQFKALVARDKIGV